MQRFKKVLKNHKNIQEDNQFYIALRNDKKEQKFRSQKKIEIDNHEEKLKNIEDRLKQAELNRIRDQ